MQRDFHLVDGVADFEQLNDESSPVRVVKFLVPANDNVPKWDAAELRLTRDQAECLRKGYARHPHRGFASRTEEILNSRKMTAWVPIGDGKYKLAPSAKGRAALERYAKLQACRNGGTAK